MAGFFPHTGGSPSGYTALPSSTHDTILNDIVADVAAQAGSNGWAVYDDQRVGFTPLLIPCNVAGANAANGLLLTNGASTLTLAGTAANARFKRSWIPGSSQISVDAGSNWYTVNALASQVAGTLDRNFTGTTTNATTGHLAVEKSGGYVVLRCTSSQKTFYVLVVRPVSIGVSLRLQVFETWNASTHVGTNPGPMEELRAYETPPGNVSTALQYVLFLLPDVFAIWCGGDPNTTSQADFFYAGNLNPLRTGDNTCLIQACSNHDLSALASSPAPAYSTTTAAGGPASVFKNLAGTYWANPGVAGSVVISTLYTIAPRGLDYLWAADRASLDESAKFQFTELDAYYNGPGGTIFAANEGKRGELRYIKSPVMNPSGMHLASLGPADDGNTYMMLRVSYPQANSAAITSYISNDFGGNQTPLSGFAHSLRTGTAGEIVIAPGATTTSLVRRFFLMPVNL